MKVSGVEIFRCSVKPSGPLARLYYINRAPPMASTCPLFSSPSRFFLSLPSVRSLSFRRGQKLSNAYPKETFR